LTKVGEKKITGKRGNAVNLTNHHVKYGHKKGRIICDYSAGVEEKAVLKNRRKIARRRIA